MNTKNTPKIGISACLLGQNVRYDACDRTAHWLLQYFHDRVTWIPVCPEKEFGLPVPRDPMRLVGDEKNPRLVVEVSGEDRTDTFWTWAQQRAIQLQALHLAGFVLKCRSPSCGIQSVSLHDQQGRVCKKTGTGLFAKALLLHLPNLLLVEDQEIEDANVLEAFYKRTLRAM